MLSVLKSCFTVKKPYTYKKLEYQAAGCLFTDNYLVLAGYHPHKTMSYISGIGGNKMPGEEFQRTAFRETLEELFNLQTFPNDLLEMIEYIIVPTKIQENGNYVLIILTFKDLDMILKICKEFHLKSPLYEVIPLTWKDLIFNRKKDITAEVSHLALVPLDKNIKFDPYFIEDLGLLPMF